MEEKQVMEKGKQVVIVDEEPKQLRVCFHKNILYILRRFFRYVEEHPFMFQGMKKVHRDLVLLQAFLTHRPQQFVEDGTLKEIHYFAHEAAMIISEYDLEEMDQLKASDLVKRVNFYFIDMSREMDVIRMIYGKEPKHLRVCFDKDILQPHLDALLGPLEDQEFQIPLKKWENHVSKLGGFFQYVEKSAAFMVVPGMKQVSNDLELLQAFLIDRPQQLVGYGRLMGEIHYLATEVVCIISKYDLEEMVKRLNCHLKLMSHWMDLIRMIYGKHPEASSQVHYFVDNLAPVDALVDYLVQSPLELRQMESIVKNIALLGAILMDPPEEYIEDDTTLKKLEFIASEIGFTISSIDLNNMDQYMADLLCDRLSHIFESHLLSTLLYKVNQIYAERPKPSRMYYPKTAQIDFVDHLVANLGELLVKAKADPSICLMRFNIILLQWELQRASCQLKEIQEPQKEEADIKDVITSIANLAYEAEYVIDSFLVGDIPISYSMLWLRDIQSELKRGLVKMGLGDAESTKKDVVGFMHETESMLERLTRGPSKLYIISIVGMAGQGKTTLAQKLFSHPLVNEHFDTRAWCCVSQVYETRQLLLELLGQVVQLSNTDHHKDYVELAEMLYKHLKGRRFLIFLDDIWEINVWNDLRRCFPIDNNGSRIIFTTRIQGLASQAKSDSILQSLFLLSDDESWALLEIKLFQKESCPTELLGVGRQIAKNCKGLPLSIVLTAGLLAKIEKRVSQWEYIAKSLNPRILNDWEAPGKYVIELSYEYLPDHLKSCFLYFGAFLEDREVQVTKLMRLWIAEGFIKHTALKGLEDVAEDYLMDLIGRNLITVAQEKSNGGVKSCHIHDLLREFCLTKAKEGNFMQMIDGYDHDMDPSDSSSTIAKKCHLRRLCIYSKRNHFTMLKPSGPFVRSLLFFAASDMGPSYSYDISSIFHKFKFLKTLNLEGINIGDSFKEIGALSLLRYLACQSYVDLIPSSIANLWDLQTFLFKGFGAEVVKVPDSIWDMTELRHVHINDGASFELDPNRLENSFILDNLQTFSTPSLAYGDDMEKMLRKVRGIRKLKCIFLDSWNDASNCNQFPELGFLSQLVSLNVFYNGMRKYPYEFNLPLNLKKLTLSNFRMPWNEISQLAKALCNLEVLKLLHNAFKGERWEMEDEVFPKLKFLKLDTLNVVEWSATDDNFPNLKCLLLHNCEQLEEIPLGIGEIPTLQMIEVMWCSRSVAISAIQIQKEQLEYGEGLKIHVHPKI